MTNNYQQARYVLKDKPSQKYKFIRLGLFLLFFVSLFSWMFVDFNLVNFKLAWFSVAIGLFVAWWISFILERLVPGIVVIEKSQKPNIGVLIGAIFMCITPVITQTINKEIFNGKKRCKSYKILNKTEFSGGHTNYSFDVLIENKNQTIHCSKIIWTKLRADSNVVICITTGGLGFDYIDKIIP